MGDPGTNTHVTSRQHPPNSGRAVRGTGSGRAAVAGSGALVGIVTALVALGVAQLIAAILSSPIGQPVTAVGEMSINHTPAAVKDFAIREFGSSDKTVLVWGIRGVLIIFAAVIGMMAVRRLWLGMAGLAVFIAVGILAAESQPTSTVGDAFPTVVGGLAAALFLWKMTGLARAAAGLPRSWQAEPAAP